MLAEIGSKLYLTACYVHDMLTVFIRWATWTYRAIEVIAIPPRDHDLRTFKQVIHNGAHAAKGMPDAA